MRPPPSPQGPTSSPSPAAPVPVAGGARAGVPAGEPVAGTPVSDADIVVILSKHQDQIDDLTTLVEDLSAQLAAIRSHLAAGPGWSDD